MNNFSISSMHIDHETEEKAIVLRLLSPAQPATSQAIIEAVKSLLATGHTHLIVDLTNVLLLNLTTLFTLFSVAALVINQEPPDPKGGWNALHTIVGMLKGRQVANMRLAGANRGVAQVLQQGGLAASVAMYPTVNQAALSFAPQPKPVPKWELPLTPAYVNLNWQREYVH